MIFDEYKTITLPNGNTIEYKIKDGTAYHKETRESVINALEYARKNNKRIRLFYGDVKTGKCWLEEYDTIGYVGRSIGDIKIPLLIKNRNSIGGPGILDDCIVRITLDKNILYTHEYFHIGEFSIKESYIDDYKFDVLLDGKCVARFKTKEKAERWIRFMKGEANRK
jgi:hypothetical protein